jgi:hypothetical protein
MTPRPELFGPLDAVALVFWGTVLLLLARYVVNKRYPTDPTRAYFLPALGLKFFGGVMVGVIYQYYYSNGDTNMYFRTALAWLDLFQNDPGSALALLRIEHASLVREYPELGILAKQYGVYYAGKANEMAVVQFITPFVPLAFNTYYGTSLFITCFSMVGVWGLYRVFVSHFPQAHRELAWGILFLPSLFFWGSGVLKDSICLGGLGIIVYTANKINEKGLASIPKQLHWVGLSFFSGYTIYAIKPYILLSLLGIMSVWIGLSQKNKIENPFVRSFVAPILLVVFMAIGGFAVVQLSADQQRYNLDNVIEQAAIIQDDLTKDYYYVNKESGGSRYDIGDFDPTPLGVLSVMPVCVMFAWFRPLLWEVNSIVMLAAAIETMYVIYLFVLMLRDAGLRGFIRGVFTDPLLLFSFLYAFFFGVMVGLTSGNYGNLTRYRIPMMPFLMAMIILVRHKALLQREAKAAIAKLRPAKRMALDAAPK